MTKWTVTIIGCGMIGGSVGLALKRRRSGCTVACMDLSDNLKAIEDAGFADHVGTLDDLPEILKESALVVLAAPVEVILDHLGLIAPHLAPGTVVTDVGGTKSQIVERASQVLGDQVHFVGGHPIAGSESSGVQAADPLLFKGQVYVLCPQPHTPPQALLTLLDMVEDLLALPLTMEPEEHDRILAMVSHVPQLLSIALVHAALEEDSFHSLLDMTAGRGFLDLTRIAASRFEQWQGVLQTNRQSICDALDRLDRSIKAVRSALESDDLADLWASVSARRRKMSPQNRPQKRKVDLRVLIDQYDERILKALSDRMRAVRQMGKLKADRAVPVYDPDRERRLKKARHEWGKTLGIPPELLDDLFDVIVTHSKKLQQ